MITLSFISKLKVTDTLCIYTYDFERETLERRDERDRCNDCSRSLIRLKSPVERKSL
jgi:hypothetical protein